MNITTVNLKSRLHSMPLEAALALCVLHHKTFDLGAFTVAESLFA